MPEYDTNKARFSCNDCDFEQVFETGESPMECPDCGSTDVKNKWPAEL